MGNLPFEWFENQLTPPQDGKFLTPKRAQTLIFSFTGAMLFSRHLQMDKFQHLSILELIYLFCTIPTFLGGLGQ